MSSNSTFTKRTFGLDNSVWLTMLGLIIVSLGLIAFKTIKKDKKAPCTPGYIYVNGRVEIEKVHFDVDENLTFRYSPYVVNDKVKWEFGDDTKQGEGFSAVHSYGKEGYYTVKITVNGECVQTKRVRVQRAVNEIRDSSGNVTEFIIGSDEGLVNEEITFQTPMDAGSYEWFIQDNSYYQKQNEKKASFKFRRQGNYIVVLVLDRNREKRYTKQITISNKPAGDNADNPAVLLPPNLDIAIKEYEKEEVVKPVDTPIIKKAPPLIVSDEIFHTYLQNFVCGEKEAKEFERYLCEGENTPVIINKEERKNFAALCADIKGKRIKISSVNIVRDENKCVKHIAVEYDKKSKIFGRNPCKN